MDPTVHNLEKILIFARDCSKTSFDTSRGEGDKTGFVALSPQTNPVVVKLNDLFVDVFGFKTRYFNDFDDMKDYISDQGDDYVGLDSNGDKNSICFGISFDAVSSRQWTYNFHYNLTGNPEFRDLYGFDDEEERVAKFEQEDRNSVLRNVKSGMFYLINYIDTEILREEESDTGAFINADLVFAPTAAYKTSTVYSNLSGNMSTLIIFPLLVIYLRFTYLVLYEKEHKIAQNLRNMGMSMYQFYFSWWVFYTILIFLYSLVWTLLTKPYLGPDANVFLYFNFYFLTGEFFISLGIFISSFFSKAKPGVLGAIVSYLVMTGIDIAKTSISGATLTTNTWFSLSPLAGLEGATSIMLLV